MENSKKKKKPSNILQTASWTSAFALANSLEASKTALTTFSKDNCTLSITAKYFCKKSRIHEQQLYHMQERSLGNLNSNNDPIEKMNNSHLNLSQCQWMQWVHDYNNFFRNFGSSHQRFVRWNKPNQLHLLWGNILQ